MNIDFNKYKRVFAFGCSFTSYIYPTWADILFKEFVDAELYNFGRGGAGNLQIGSNVVQANLKFKFCETDLIMIMYTSPMREDRYIEGRWVNLGNVFNQHYYDKKFVKKYCDPIGLLIRDFTQIALTKQYIDSLTCDSIQMLGDDYTSDIALYDEKSEYLLGLVNNVFKEVITSFDNPKLTKPIGFDSFYQFDNASNDFVHDGHPNPKEYFEFLQSMNFPLTELSLNYVTDAMKFIDSGPKHIEEIRMQFPEITKRFNQNISQLL